MKDLEELDIRQHGVSENEISIFAKCFEVIIVLLTKGEDEKAAIYHDSCCRLLRITKSIHSRLSWNTISDAFHSIKGLFSLAGKHV